MGSLFIRNSLINVANCSFCVVSVQKCETILKLYPLGEIAEANKRKLVDKNM